MNKYKNGILVFLSVLMALIISVSAVAFAESSYINISSEDGNYKYTEFAPYPIRNSKIFEDSSMFETILKNELMELTRFVVIRNQCETNGEYNGKKEIDIGKFANRDRGDFGEKTKVRFALDDLIKWGNYGFDYQIVTGTESQLDAYFAAISKNLKSGMEDINAYQVNVEEMQELTISRESKNVAESYKNADSESRIGELRILIPRYKSVEGRDLLTYADTRSEYEKLVEYLTVSAEELFVNFSEYADNKSRYESGKTNILYCYQLNDGNGEKRYSNLSTSVTGMSNDELSKYFSSMPGYIYFNPDKLQITSTVDGIDAVYMKQNTDPYGYSFGDNSRLWIGVEAGYPREDILRAAYISYSSADKIFPLATAGGLTALLLLMVFVVALTVNAGRNYYINENNQKEIIFENKRTDYLPTELYVLLLGMIIALLTVLGIVFNGVIEDTLSGSLSSLYGYIFGGAVGTMGAWGILSVYIILVRKIKGGLIWKGSLLQLIITKIRGFIVECCNHGSVVSRTWLPYLIFLFFNLVVILMGLKFLPLAAIVDLFVGVGIYRNTKAREGIIKDVAIISRGNVNHRVAEDNLAGDNLKLARAVNSIGAGIKKAVETSMKDEKLKADLITNVSHDIKTPLTSIINYVDLIKREDIQDEKIKGYISVLDQKSQRLKDLIDDLVEASKLSSGAVVLNMEKINLSMLMEQATAEFDDKFRQRGLTVISSMSPQSIYICGDGRGIYRIIENMYNNVYKYALENTRVYVNLEEAGPDIADEIMTDLKEAEGYAMLSIKNISARELNITPEELLERFTRGDSSRKTEGSGLGLSIAKNLTAAMGGDLSLTLDGDLFKVKIILPIYK